MIGMMYLVLTALLALNVSKDILDAFVVVNEGLEQTVKNFGSKINDTYARFAKADEAEHEKVGEYYKKALQVQKVSNELVEYMQQVKDELFMKVDGLSPQEFKTQGLTLRQMSSKDNYDVPTTYFMGQDEKSGKAFEMHRKIDEFKQELVKIVNDTNFKLPKGLDTDGPFENADKEKETWERHNFYHLVAAATYTLLNKTIGEVRNMESEVVAYLYSAIDASSHKFSDVEAKVIPNSRIVFAGDRYEADIIVAAYDKNQNPKVYWKSGIDTAREDMKGSLTAIEGFQGIAKLSIPTSATGSQKFAGLIELVGPGGEAQFYGFKSSYTVTRPAAAVAAEKMNVFYAGIPNPVSIAAPVAPEQLKINWGGASATSLGGGRYDVTVAQGGPKEVTITVSAEMEKGKVQNMGSTTFRVKTVPEPTMYIGGSILGGRQPKELILANPALVARMSPDFNYELRWQVLSYKVIFTKNGVEDTPISVTGHQFSEQVKSKIQSASPGTTVEFVEIKIQSIAGTRSVTSPLMVRIK
jgi:gliding motility-associated protein GldM